MADCTSKYEIWIRDNVTLQPVHLVTQYKNIELIRRKNRTGSFALTFDISCNSFPYYLLNDNYGFERYGIIVYREGARYFTGPITRVRRTLNGNERELVITGTDDKGWLDRRFCLPDPWYFVTQFNQAFDRRTGSAESAMKAYVDKNLGPGAVGSRRLPNLIIEPNGAGGVGRGVGVNYVARFDKLSKVVQDLITYINSYDYDIVQETQEDGSEKLVFKLVRWYSRPQEQWEFSIRRGNLINYDYSYEIPDYNVVLVGGGRTTGNENNPVYRQFAWASNEYSRSRWGDIEHFIDRRGTTNQAELQQAAWDALRIPDGIEKPEQNMFGKINVTCTLTEINGMKLDRDWKVGDFVHCVLEYDEYGEPATEIYHFIKEVRLTIDPKEGERIEATIGSNDAVDTRYFPFPFITDSINDLEERLLNLEGSAY